MCFGVTTPSSGSSQVVLAKVMKNKMTKYNVVMRYDKILVNVAAYVK
jgi:hypothetical protein